MRLEEEFNKRMEKKDLFNDVIGAEIKRQRIKLAKTQSSIADDICSLSYLCKIEKNTIIPNKQYLGEICERVNISKKDMNNLLNLKDIMLLATKAFYEKDNNKLNLIEIDMRDFTNYRAKIVKFIVMIYQKKYLEANELYEELFKIVSTMADNDLLIFTCFAGIFQADVGKYEAAVNAMKLVDKYNHNFEYLTLIILENKFNIYSHLNSPKVLLLYKELQSLFSSNGQIIKLNDLNYKYNIYLIKNYFFDEVKINSIIDVKKAENLKFLIALYSKKKMSNIDFNLLDDAYKVIYCYLYDNKSFKTALFEYETNVIYPQDEYIFIKYLDAKLNDDNIEDYLIDIAYSYSIANLNVIFARFYLNEIRILLKKQAKYKRFFEISLKYDEMKEIVDKI